MPQRNERVFFIRSSFARLAHRLTVLFILLWSSCFLELRSEDGYSPARIKFCYDTEKEGYRLNTTVYKKFHALSGTDCAVHCVHDHCCRSVNYRKDPVYDGNENCELLYTVESEQPENLKPDQRYDYYLLLEPERSFDCNCSPCENNGTCRGRSNCSCLAGFSGKRCEKELPPTNPPPAGLASPRPDPPVGMPIPLRSATPIKLAPPPGPTRPAQTYFHPSPCLNGGVCIQISNGYKCQCASHFRGTNCEAIVMNNVDECIPSSCHQNTTCNNTLGSYKCTCRHGGMVNGIRCEDSLYSSKILRGEGTYLKHLYQWLNDETKWKLCYRASDHGWRTEDFHSNCDGKGQTVTIVRVGDYIFGGYSDVDWSGSSGYRQSSKAFLFSLRNKDNLQPFKSSIPSNRTTYAIYTGPSSGPTFGKSHDLGISGNSHTRNSSYTDFGYTYQLPTPAYSYGTVKTRQLLAGSYYFLTSEIEVYYMY